MIEDQIRKIVKLAGNQNRYQFIVILICFIMWSFAPLFSCILGFLENVPSVSYYDKELNETVVESMNYDICKWPKSNYTIVETFDYSWIIDLNIPCEKVKISMLGVLVNVGSAIGSSTSSSVTALLGQKWTLRVMNIILNVLLMLTLAIHNYYYYCVVTFLVPICCNTCLFSVMVLFSAIIKPERKAFFNICISSGLGIGAAILALLFWAFKNWRYVFICNTALLVTAGILIEIFFIENPVVSLKKGRFKEFLNGMKFIAKINNRLDKFEEAIKEGEYKEILEQLAKKQIKVKDGEEGNNDNKKEGNVRHNELNDINKIKDEKPVEIELQEKPHVNGTATDPNNDNINYDKNAVATSEPALGVEAPKTALPQESPLISAQGTPANFTLNTPATQLIQTPKNELETPKTETSLPVIETKPSEDKSNQTSSQPILPTNIACLFKYASVRWTFLLICLLWMCNSMLYSGLSIGVKSLPGDIFTNSLILYAAETGGYYFAGFIMNTKRLGRKGSLMLLTGGFGLMCLLMFILFKYETVGIVLYIITRFFVMGAYVIYYTFSLESYPVSIKALAYGINGASNNIGGAIAPFIIEYLPRKIAYLIYAIVGVICTLLMLLLKETNGVIPPDNIPEMVVEVEKERMKKIPAIQI